MKVVNHDFEYISALSCCPQQTYLAGRFCVYTLCVRSDITILVYAATARCLFHFLCELHRVHRGAVLVDTNLTNCFVDVVGVVLQKSQLTSLVFLLFQYYR